MEQRKRSWLTRRDKVKLFEQVRREHEFGVGTISGVSRKLSVHRRLAREALTSADPAASKPQERRLRKLEAATPIIGRILSADQHAPPKQRHTAHRIWQRRCAGQPGFAVSERYVCGYPWTAIEVGDRTAYLSALDRASIEMDIQPLAKFIATSAAKLPKQVDAQCLSALNELAAYEQE